jgi:uncharacterized protein
MPCIQWIGGVELYDSSRKFITLIALSALLLYLPASFADVTFPDKPNRKDYFVDTAMMIDTQHRTEINDIAKAILKEEKIPIYVVTINSLADYEASGLGIEEYATRLFDQWGIGFKDRNYGILLLVSKGDRKARIELGAGWDHKYDSQSKDIMDNLIIKQFKRGDFSLGILDGVRGLDAMARGLSLPKATTPWWVLPLTIIGAILLVLLIINLFKTGRSGWAWALIAAIAVMLFFMLRSAASSGGGFGGGFSGGGGATGSW